MGSTAEKQGDKGKKPDVPESAESTGKYGEDEERAEKMTQKEEKEARIKKEFNRLRRVFRDLDKNKSAVVIKLINRAAFMSVSLEDLEEEINESGYTDEYCNGENQYGTKQSEAVKTHLAMMKNLTTVIRQLTELVPPAKRKKSKLEALREE